MKLSGAVVALVVGAAMCLIGSVAGAAEAEYMSGRLIDQQGNITKITAISASGYIKGRYQGKEVEIKFSNLKKLENLGQGFWRITNRQGKQFNIEQGEVYTHNTRIYYRYFSPIELKEAEQTVSYGEVRFLELGGEIGRLKVNQRTEQYFPPDYIYDPYTGEKLDWRNPGH